VQQLPCIVIIKVVHKLSILCRIQCFYRSNIRCDMVESPCICKPKKRMAMHTAVERWIFQGNKTHCFQPVCTGRLDMETSLDRPLQNREDTELVTA
jgi:hypothetical protein